jgi:hypothetical protein
MLKVSIYAIVVLTVILGTWLAGRTREKQEQDNQKTTQIILYTKGKETNLDEHTLSFKQVWSESEQLFVTADSGYRLIMTKERLEDIKRNQIAIEVVYPTLQSVTLRNQRSIYFTKLLIPLKGQFANGTVFFAGSDAYTLHGKDPDYSLLLEYGSTNFVRNTGGLGKLKAALEQMGVRTD